MQRFTLDRWTRIGFVGLRVHDMTQMVAWYQRTLGLTLLRQDAHQALLGTGRRHVLAMIEGGGRLLKSPPGGLAGFGLNMPDQQSLLAVAARLKAQGIALSWWETGFALGFSFADPEQNQLRIAYDPGLSGSITRTYDFAAGTTLPAQAPPLPTGAWAGLPDRVSLAQIVVRTQQVADTVTYLADILGFVVQQQAEDHAFLTVGDAASHISMAVVLAKRARPRQPNHAGGRYVNLVVSSAAALAALEANVRGHHWPVKAVVPAQYLMVTGPNRLTLWFSVGGV
ncbi:VOC family protein [Lacticaseibacillus parakribbianus]|uniref:VOC family protein n=1 Tax=Lacticaseibacillus parakribbianus TaxID=2970927 RepID=UPI0021CB25BC|nr:VOC family protein [Lacticaseibacillus parakribbianus]